MKNKTNIQLPYFDALLTQLEQGNDQTATAFGRHVHWGYWDNPNLADGSVSDFAKAAEALAQKVCYGGKIENNLRILDVGCGFGGTIASLNERFSNLELVGLNIDERQLIRAREEVKAQNNNYIEFVCGDACEMPFADASFDVVLAVECIFHFPSRAQFFAEAKRVLRPQGKLAICDFVPLPLVFPFLGFMGKFLQSSVSRTYGNVDSSFTLGNYRQLAQKTGFQPLLEEDITVNTLPTYPVVKRLFAEMGDAEDEKVTAAIEWASRLGILRYLILSYTSL